MGCFRKMLKNLKEDFPDQNKKKFLINMCLEILCFRNAGY